MTYRVYYSDGTTFDGPGQPPPRDIQAILQRNEEGQLHVRSGGDYYVLRDGIWIEVDIFGLFDYLMDTGLVLFGRTVSNDTFSHILARAMADMDSFDG